MSERPFWFPTPATEEEFEQDGWRYTDTHDHLGDSREHWEPAADWILDAVKVLKELKELPVDYEEGFLECQIKAGGLLDRVGEPHET